METTEQVRRVRLSVVLVLGVAALAAGLLALMWWKTQSAEATTDPVRIIFVSSRNATAGNYYDIYSMAPDGTDVKRITNRPGDEWWPDISPDGTKIAFQSNNTNNNPDIYTINADGSGAEVNVTNTSGGEYYPAWSPDGSKIAYSRWNPSSSSDDIYTINAGGSGTEVSVTNTPNADENQPSWSADGSKIAFTSTHPRDSDAYYDNWSYDIYSTSANGTGQRANLTNSSGVDELWPSYSPDGSKIAYSRYSPSDNTYDIYKMNADGSEQTAVAVLSGEQYVPDWSPDGSQLTFSSINGAAGSDWEIFKIGADGSNVMDLTNNSVDDLFSSWGTPSSTSGSSDTTVPVLNLPPNLNEEATSAAGAAVSFTASALDDIDGPVGVSCASASGLTSGNTFPIGTTTVSCKANDAAGNVATGSFTITVRDTTAPNISGVPADLTVKATSLSGAQVSYTSPTASDLVDGSVSVNCSPASGTTFAIGKTQVSCSASDSRNNTATRTFTVSVVYNFGAGSGGFLAPIDNYPTLNSMKPGGTVPVKFSLGGDFGLDIFAAGYPVSRRITCNTQTLVDPVEEFVAASNSGLRYDATINQYSYNWKTEKSWSGTCRQLILKLKDGSEHPVNFQFK